MQNIFGNLLDLNEIKEPVDCYCVSQKNFVYDIYHYTVPCHTDKKIVHEFHEAFRLILVPVGKALCNDRGEIVRTGMFLK